MADIDRSTLKKAALTDPAGFLAFGLGSGLSPWAPGTAGTLAAVPFAFMLWPLPPLVQILLLSALFVLGVYLCARAATELGVHDHGAIVWDEMVGYWLTVLFVPLTLWGFFLAFVLFRFFDIVKPWPIRLIDRRVGGGFGIMLDDLLAAGYAIAVLLLLQRWTGVL